MNRPYQISAIKSSLKDEVIDIRQKYLADQEDLLQKELASYEFSIKEAALKGEDQFRIDIPQNEMGCKFLFWFPYLKGASIHRFNKLVDLGFLPKIYNYRGEYFAYRYIEIQLI